jgi:hypothetical protein
MKVVVQFSARQEEKALPILLRHESGMMLPNRTYILSDSTISRLREANITFQEISRDGVLPSAGRAVTGERI